MLVQVRPLTAGISAAYHGPCPSRLSAWSETAVDLPADGTHFGVATAGPATLRYRGISYPVPQHSYFSAPGGARVEGGAGLLVTRVGYEGLFQLGGPVESRGRLRYIDGCSDTLLIAPVRKGDACLNLLHVPPHTAQTAHTHPSLRAGVVLAGAGLCRTPTAEHALSPGAVFELPTGELHSFHTSGAELLIVAYHPDSDFGPTDESHPMLNRTFVGGQSMRRAPNGGAS